MTTSPIASVAPFIELSFPSELGYEKVARDAVAAFARRLGCDRERVEDLKTALGEACINAIEHGNARRPGLRVDIQCTGAADRLTVEVCDSGLNRYTGDLPAAGIDLKLRGLAPRRGMGLMMISQLVDEAGFTESHEGGNRFRLVLYFRKA
ncbi:MAG TPA: ATP-binding protein [Kouleothrix sp.]|nr:ATP-binding protein [Kouleothrix sp.]HRC77499.1 ATP-binding protein [Kouleothrix sp.]